MMSDQMTTREVADICHVAEWQVRRLFELGVLSEPPKFGGKRVIFKDTLPTIVEKLRERGWIRETEAAPCA